MRHLGRLAPEDGAPSIPLLQTSASFLRVGCDQRKVHLIPVGLKSTRRGQPMKTKHARQCETAFLCHQKDVWKQREERAARRQKRALAESILAEVEAEQEVGEREEGDEVGAQGRVTTAEAPPQDEPCPVDKETASRLADLSQKLQQCAAEAHAASKGLISIAEFLECATGLRGGGANVHSDDVLLRIATPGCGNAAAMVEQVTRDGIASIGKKIKKAVSSAPLVFGHHQHHPLPESGRFCPSRLPHFAHLRLQQSRVAVNHVSCPWTWCTFDLCRGWKRGWPGSQLHEPGHLFPVCWPCPSRKHCY
jgi:hypothetical protein